MRQRSYAGAAGGPGYRGCDDGLRAAAPASADRDLLVCLQRLADAGPAGADRRIWAEKFDHIAAVTNFVVVPLSFLSGTFYSVERLPENWLFIAHLNPFFYLIDGFRYGLIGVHDGDILRGAVIVGVVNAVLWALAYGLVSRGYKLKP